MTVVSPGGIAHSVPYFCSGEDGPEGLGSGIFDVREFSFQQHDDVNWLVTVEAIAAMPQADAQLFIDRPGDEAIFRLWGDDQWDDDLLAEFRPQTYWASPEGLGMRGGEIVRKVRIIEEDSNYEPAGAGEWYVGIRLTDIRNGLEHKVESCMIKS